VLLNQHLRQGKPIGGTSAGLAVLGDTVYAAYGESIRSDEALKEPFSKNITLERGFLQLPFLANVITDSHFSERGRLGRLLSFQAAGAELRGGAPLIGMGVDEETALAIGADGRSQIFSRQASGRVYLSIFEPEARVKRVAGEALSISEVIIIGLSKDSTVQLPQFAIEEAAEFSRVEVVDGRVLAIGEDD
jgi:cyanophycinase-like exopeptidase